MLHDIYNIKFDNNKNIEKLKINIVFLLLDIEILDFKFNINVYKCLKMFL